MGIVQSLTILQGSTEEDLDDFSTFSAENVKRPAESMVGV